MARKTGAGSSRILGEGAAALLAPLAPTPMFRAFEPNTAACIKFSQKSQQKTLLKNSERGFDHSVKTFPSPNDKLLLQSMDLHRDLVLS